MTFRSIKFKICHLFKRDLTYFIDALKILDFELYELNADVFKIYCVGGFVYCHTV